MFGERDGARRLKEQRVRLGWGAKGKDPITMLKSERMQWLASVQTRREIEIEIHEFVTERGSIPEEWHEIWKDGPHRDNGRARVTLSLDADVVKFFKRMGPGYQPRMNRVLKAFMHMRLCRLIEGPDVNDYVLRPEQVLEESDLG